MYTYVATYINTQEYNYVHVIVVIQYVYKHTDIYSIYVYPSLHGLV